MIIILIGPNDNKYNNNRNNNSNNDNLYGAMTWPYHYKDTSQTTNKWDTP